MLEPTVARPSIPGPLQLTSELDEKNAVCTEGVQILIEQACCTLDRVQRGEDLLVEAAKRAGAVAQRNLSSSGKCQDALKHASYAAVPARIGSSYAAVPRRIGLRKDQDEALVQGGYIQSAGPTKAGDPHEAQAETEAYLTSPRDPDMEAVAARLKTVEKVWLAQDHLPVMDGVQEAARSTPLEREPTVESQGPVAGLAGQSITMSETSTCTSPVKTSASAGLNVTQQTGGLSLKIRIGRWPAQSVASTVQSTSRAEVLAPYEIELELPAIFSAPPADGGTSIGSLSKMGAQGVLPTQDLHLDGIHLDM